MAEKPLSAYQARQERVREQGRQEGRLEARERAASERERSLTRSRDPGRSGLPRLPGNPNKVLLGSEIVVLISTTAYGFLGPNATGKEKLPDPRQIIAALGFFSLLGLVGSLGRGAATFVSYVGVATALTLLLTGRTGKGMLLLVEQLTRMAKPPGGLVGSLQQGASGHVSQPSLSALGSRTGG